jgi:hypothetical protein
VRADLALFCQSDTVFMETPHARDQVRRRRLNYLLFTGALNPALSVPETRLPGSHSLRRSSLIPTGPLGLSVTS